MDRFVVLRGPMAARRATVYLNMVIMLAFLVGQVRYECSSYYCTMMHSTVSNSAVGTSSVQLPCGCSCKASQRLRSPRVGQQLAARGCLRLIKRQKKVVSNYTDSVKNSVPLIASLYLVSLVDRGLRSDTHSFYAFIDSKPPPLDLTIVNLVLRI